MISLPGIDITCAHQVLVFLFLFLGAQGDYTLATIRGHVASSGRQASAEVTYVTARARHPRAHVSSLCSSPPTPWSMQRSWVEMVEPQN